MHLRDPENYLSNRFAGAEIIAAYEARKKRQNSKWLMRTRRSWKFES
jgi:hypothetical protein